MRASCILATGPAVFGTLAPAAAALLVLLLLVFLAPPAAAQARGVWLEGDPELVAGISAELTRRGTATPPAAAEAIRVTLARTPEGIQVTLRDRYGRMAERTVASQDTALTLIESWTSPDDAELLTPRRTAPASLSPPPVAVTAQVSPALRTSASPSPSRSPSPSPLRFALRLIGERPADAEDSWWLAAGFGACARLGPVCLGAEGRFTRRMEEGRSLAPGWFAAESDHQSDWQGLLTAELPISLWRSTLVLGFGAGGGRWLQGRSAIIGYRSEVRASLVVPLWSALAVEMGLSARLVPATREGFQPGPADQLLRAGLGLRWGLP
jgi:hypothetical protein